MKIQGILLILIVLLISGVSYYFNRGGKTKALFNFQSSDVDSLSLLEIEHPLLGGIISTKFLTKDKYNEFIDFVNSSYSGGQYKTYTCYVIKVKLQNGEIQRFWTNGELISNNGNDRNYYCKLKSNSILSFFGLNDTIDCNKIKE